VRRLLRLRSANAGAPGSLPRPPRLHGTLTTSARRATLRRSWKSFVVRGDVHEIKLPRGRGRVQHGRRFAVIVQADDLLALSTIVVCPTSTTTPPASFHPEVRLGDDQTRIMCEMVGAVDARTLGS